MSVTDSFVLPDDIDALIFDCDGTLADTFPAYYRGTRKVLAEFQYEFEAAFYAERLGLSRYHLLNEIERLHGVHFDEQELASRLNAAFVDEIAHVRPIAYTNDLARAQRGRLKLGVASGGPKANVVRTLKTIGLYDLFDTVVAIEDTGIGKPAPDLYLKAASNLGVAPSRVQTFEDSDEGVAAAKAAGMRVLDIRAYYRTDPAQW